MKKLTYAIALCTLLLAGCSQDEAMMENKGELVTLNYNVSLGDGVQSRTGETDETKTFLVNELLCAVYEIDENGAAIGSAKYTTTRPVENGKASFAPTLSDELDYKIVFFAYYNGKKCYNLTDLHHITVDNTTYVNASNTEKDAFTSTDIIRKGNSDKNGSVSLVRPFGKISVLTSEQDYNNAIGLKGTPTGSTLTITGHNDVYNALTETWSQSQVGSTSITLTSSVSTTNKTIGDKNYYYLADEYLFAGGESTTTCHVVVYGEDANQQTIELYNKNIPNVPVGTNASTNLYNENLLTGGGVIYNISIETGFSNNDETNQGIDGAETENQNGEEGSQEGTENQ